MCMAALFITAERWKQPQNVVHAYNGILFSFKKKAILTHATTWMSLQDRNQAQRDNNCIIPFA